jgi:SAM-dependent methyltransferase
MPKQQQPDDYRSLAAYYDLVYARLGPDDVPFYLDWAARQAGAAGGASMLELGCGTGRVTLPLAGAGHSVTALDISPAMLDILRGKLAQEPADVRGRVQVVEADMAEFDFQTAAGRRRHGSSLFDLVLAPFRAFQHLMETGQQRAMLTRVREHLAPGGLYIHNQFEPNYPLIVENMRRGAAWQVDCTIDLPDGGVVQRSHIPTYDLGRQRLDAQFRLDEYGPDMVLHRSALERIAMRMTHRQELLYLLELCGLAVRASFSGYHGEPLGSDLARGDIVLVCEAA